MKIGMEVRMNGYYNCSGGSRLYYRVIEGEGDPVVFLHPTCADGGIWDEQRGATSGQPFVTIDLAGHGMSLRSSSGYGVQAQAAAIAELLSRGLGCDRYTLVGNSLGGFVALQMCYDLRDSSQIAGALVSGSATNIAGPEWPAARVRELGRSVLDHFASKQSGGWSGSNMSDEVRGQLRGYRDAMVSHSPDVLLSIFMDEDGPAYWDLGHDLAAIEQPVLIVAGAHDRRVSPDQQAELAEKLGNAQFEVIEDAGHFPQLETPDAFNQHLEAFLAEIG